MPHGQAEQQQQQKRENRKKERKEKRVKRRKRGKDALMIKGKKENAQKKRVRISFVDHE